MRTCFCRVVFVPSRPRALLVSFRLKPRSPSAHLALRTPRAFSGAFRVFFSFALRFYQLAQKKSPCLMGLCSARRHSPSPVCPLALSPLRPVSHLLSAPFQCGLCCLRVVCAKNACVDRAPFLSRRLPFLFFFLLFCRALSDTGYRFSLASASACVRARLRRRYVAGLIKSVQYSHVKITPPTVAHAARSKSRDFFIQPKFKSGACARLQRS